MTGGRRNVMNDYNNMLEQLTSGLVDIFQNSMVNIILYGSVARGTQTEESDVDIAVLVKLIQKKCMVE